jgi:FdhD protein
MREAGGPVVAARVAGADGVARVDRVAVEAPLELRISAPGARTTSTVLMRTPGARPEEDEELARGFLFTEGLIARAADVVAMRRPEGLTGDERGNVLAVELAAAIALAPAERLFYSSSACGACGKSSIAQLAVRARPAISSTVRVSRATLAALPDRLRAAQPLFAETGGVHAAALFTPDGALVAAREDVGRHNAVDKLVGWALAAGQIPLDKNILLVSGRASYEILQKAIAAGLPVVAAVGAPSSLAIDLAEQFAITLIGFLRNTSLNVYTGSLS